MRFELEMLVAVFTAYLSTLIPDPKDPCLAHQCTSMSHQYDEPIAPLGTFSDLDSDPETIPHHYDDESLALTDTYSEPVSNISEYVAEYVAASEFFLPPATGISFPSAILPSHREPAVSKNFFSTTDFPDLPDTEPAASRSFFGNFFKSLFSTTDSPDLLDDDGFPPLPEWDDFLEEDKVETYSSVLAWFHVFLVVVMIILLVKSRTKIRVLRSEVAARQANPVLVALPPPTSDEYLAEPAQTASRSTQTETVSSNSVGTQTGVAETVSVWTQTDAVNHQSVGTQTIPDPPPADRVEVGTQTIPDATPETRDVGTQTIADPLPAARVEVGTQTVSDPLPADRIEVGTQTIPDPLPADRVEVGTQTIPDPMPADRVDVGTQTTPEAPPVESNEVVELRAALAKQRKDSDDIIRNLQASLARMGSEMGQLRAQMLRNPNSPRLTPGRGGVPTYGGLAYDPHHNPNPAANAQQLAHNQAMQQRQFQQPPRWPNSPGPQPPRHR